MTRDELFEDVRTMLREAQAPTVYMPWRYSDMDLIVQIRAALRYLRMVGVTTLTGFTLDQNGLLADADGAEAEIVEDDGVLISHRVVASLVGGDLIQKLNDGELGAYFKSGPDIIDARDASKVFKQASVETQKAFEKLLAIRISTLGADTNATASVFGNQTAALDGET